MAGSVVSWVGDWMDLAALNWAVLEMTGSPLDLGLINACRLIPVFALSLPAGVLADRYDRRQLLIAITAGTMALTFVVGLLVAAHSPFWMFALAVTLRSVLAAMMPPVRNALLANLVPVSALGSAVASQAAMLNLARIIGPAIAGALIAVMPMPRVFWINGASFLAVLWTLIVVRPETMQESKRKSRPLADVQEAVRYIFDDRAVQSLLILAVVPMIFGFPYTALMPLFAKDLLDLGPVGFGILLSVSAVGALAGSTWLSIRGHSRGAGIWLIGSILAFGISLLVFVSSQIFVIASVAVFLVGLTSQIYRTLSRILLQHRVPDHLRGRILSIALMDRGLIPLGAILIGAVAEWGGTRQAGIVMGAGCILITLTVAGLRREVWNL